MKVSIIEYKGKKLAYVDYRGATEEELIAGAKQVSNVRQMNPAEILPSLVIYDEGFKFTEKLVEGVKEGFKGVDVKIAIVGLAGVMEIISKGVATFSTVRNIRFFKTEEEAKEWLVK